MVGICQGGISHGSNCSVGNCPGVFVLIPIKCMYVLTVLKLYNFAWTWYVYVGQLLNQHDLLFSLIQMI